MSETPAPNDVNPVSISYKITETDIITIIFATLFVIARVLTKVLLTHALGWDDYTSFISLCFAIGRTVVSLVGVNVYGIGRHFADIPPNDIDGLLAISTAETILYFIAIMSAKLSILLVFYRLFSVSAPFRWISIVLGSLIVLCAIICSLIVIFPCRPVEAAFSITLRTTSHAKCLNSGTVVVVFGWFNTFTDFILLLLPMPMVWRIQIKWTKKLGVALVFATGAFLSAISIVRLCILYQNPATVDPTWNVVTTKIWLAIELNLAIICGCLPALQPLFRQLPRFMTNYLPISVRTRFSSHNVASEPVPEPRWSRRASRRDGEIELVEKPHSTARRMEEAGTESLHSSEGADRKEFEFPWESAVSRREEFSHP